jgi:hypothetical protein
MTKLQRGLAVVFALFLWLVAFGAMISSYGDHSWLALVALIAGMGFALLAAKPSKP